MSKLFTAVINDRLQCFSAKYYKIREYQAGLRKNFSMHDHIIALHTLTDLKCAFDSVWRSGLLLKIQQFDIIGKCYNVIKSMYDQIKSCISVNGVMSIFFWSNIGVRQGEN